MTEPNVNNGAAVHQPPVSQPAAAPTAAPAQPYTAQATAQQVPPAAQPQPAPQPQYTAPAPAPAPVPQNIPGMPLMVLTDGMKFGWLVCGLFMGPIAILIAWLTNAANFPKAKNDAVKFALFGFLIQMLLGILFVVLFGMAACASIGAASSAYSMYGGSSYGYGYGMSS